MVEISIPAAYLVIGALSALLALQVGVGLFSWVAMRRACREQALASREIFGLVRKLEGLTSSKREQMLKQYDKILDQLSHRLPPTIASQASEQIFETESRILARLADLEPSLKSDQGAQKKMDELIKSMEKLEQTLVASTAETVQKILADNRRALFSDADAIEEDVLPVLLS
ncbi:MAG: hypothetical protein K1X79_00750 [Oligoflexia bacterium]|nr:hypothetical protein [Oligoflexia bacterium]